MNIIHSESEFIPAFEFSGYQLAYEATRWFRWSSGEAFESETLMRATRLYLLQH